MDYLELNERIQLSNKIGESGERELAPSKHAGERSTASV